MSDTAHAAPDYAAIAGHIGAAVTGLDLTQPLTPATLADLRAALCRHKVLFFPGQPLTHAQQVAFGAQFGPLTRRPGDLHGPHPEDHPQILSVDPDAVDPRYGRDFEERYRAKWLTPLHGWHTDLTPYPNPPAISILRAHTVPSHGGDTHWTNLAAAYNGLAQPLRDLVDNLTAEHRFFAGCHMSPADLEDARALAINATTLQVSHHPVVRVHPETNERALRFPPQHGHLR